MSSTVYDSRLVDDRATIIATKHLADVELYSSKAIAAIKKSLKNADLTLARDKQLIRKHLKDTIDRIKMENIVTSKAAINL